MSFTVSPPLTDGVVTLRERLQRALGDSALIEREIGAGGMSRVFLATDRQFGRQIVVKVLLEDSSNASGVERFRKEIQVAARLQHPHIVPLLNAGEIPATAGEPLLPFFTMPFVRGETLRDRISREGELPVADTIHILRDIAAALSFAHGEGVVHRDIKPENVILSGGVAVVTDFGVAKALGAFTGPRAPGSTLTAAGMAIGTPAYMSPEQASADGQLDPRADIYSLGCVAYEMLTGAPPFAGRSQQQLISAHILATPESITERRSATPPALASLVMRCLAKSPADRPQSAEEVRQILGSITTPSEVASTPRTHRAFAIGVAAAGVVASVAAVGWFSFSRPRGLELGSAIPIAVSTAVEEQPAISPDGKFVAYISGTTPRRLMVRQIDGGNQIVVAPQVGTGANIRWLPDGLRLSYAVRATIHVVPAHGGTPRPIVSGATHDWSPDGTRIAFERADGIWLASSDGSGARRVIPIPRAHAPAFSPDGRWLAYVEGQKTTEINVSASRIAIHEIATGKRVQISDSINTNMSPAWTPDGQSVLFVSNAGGPRDIYLQHFRAGRLIGKAVPVTTGLSAFGISLSSNWRLAYDVSNTQSNIWSLALRSRGHWDLARPITRDNQRVEELSVSPDGMWLAYTANRAGNFDVYKVPIAGGEAVQLTTNPGNDFGPAWSPAGEELVFHSQRNGPRDLYTIRSDGTGERRITADSSEDYNAHWSPDGKRIAYYVTDGQLPTLSVVERIRDTIWSKPRPLLAEGERGSFPRWSPDGRYVAFRRGNSIRLVDTGDGNRISSVVTASQLQAATLSFFCWKPGGDGFIVTGRLADGAAGIWDAPLVGRPRVILMEDSTHQFGRLNVAADRERVYFIRGSRESDVFVRQLVRR